MQMYASHGGTTRAGLGIPRAPLPSRPGGRACRGGRRPGLRVAAFKDWFSNFVVTPKEQANPAGTALNNVSLSNINYKPPPPKRDFLEARQVSVYQLFDSDEYKFNIPVYQRWVGGGVAARRSQPAS